MCNTKTVDFTIHENLDYMKLKITTYHAHGMP
jgi:hypothetical protein